VATWHLEGGSRRYRVTGLVILALYFKDLFDTVNFAISAELGLWLIAATVLISCLAVDTTRAEFLWSAGLVGLSWLTPFVLHLIRSKRDHDSHYVPVH